MTAPPQLVSLTRQTALAHNLDPALVCAIVEQESSWNPYAMRYEPLFFAKYVAPLFTNNKISATEAYSRGFSWGLMQVMGQVAREAGFDAPSLASLCDPATALDMGCRVLLKKFVAAGHPPSVAQASPSPPAFPAGGILPAQENVSTSTASGSQPSPPPSTTGGSPVTTRALQLYNGGANPDYAREVLARRARYL